MKYEISNSGPFPLVHLHLAQGEEVRIENGAMVYHNGKVRLDGKMNSGGSGGFGGALKALARSAVSGESFFVTTVVGLADGAQIALAPGSVGQIVELDIGDKQYRLNDKAFLACDSTVNYNMISQGLGKAVFGGSGGLFVMETNGRGKMLINSYGDLVELTVDGTQPLVVDNFHVVAWESTLNYQIRAASGLVGFTSGEGLVNEFQGVGKVYIQTRNASGLYDLIKRFIPTQSS
jgi:uncharacterized protein (TIGR00266 family)